MTAITLYPTKTRRALLWDVGHGFVHDVAGETLLELEQGTRKVTAQIRELELAGWVERGDCADWRLTAAGVRVLGGPQPVTELDS